MRVAGAAVLLVLCLGVYGAPAPVLPASIAPSKLRPAEHVYVATIFVGTPPEEVMVEVRFDAADLWLYRDQSIHSATFEVEYDGETQTDLVYCADVRRRMRIHTHAQPHTLTSPLLCADCGGILGLRSDSEFWQWWPSASFTPASITLGGLAPPLRDQHDVWRVPCLSADADSSLCTARVSCDGEIFDAEIAPHSPYLVAPRHFVRKYLADKNLYQDGGSGRRWEPLEIEFVDAEGATPATEGKTLAIRLDHDDLSGQHGSEARELLIVPGESNTTIVLGSALLRRVILFREAGRDHLVVHLHPVFAHLPIVHSVLFLFGFLFLARWKMTDLSRHYALPPQRLDVGLIDAAYQVLGWILAIASTALPETQTIMSEMPALYGVAIGIVTGGIIIEAAIRYVLIRYVQALRGSSAAGTHRPTKNAVLLVLNESIWHEAVLITALWLLVVARRREGIAGPLTAVVALVGLYSITVDLYYIAVFIGARMVVPAPASGKKPPQQHRASTIALTVLAAVSTVLLFGVYSVLFVWFFGLPFAERSAAIYSQLSLTVIVTLAVLAVLAGAWMTTSYLRHGAAVLVKQRIAARAEAEEDGKAVGVSVSPVDKRR